MNKKIRIGIGIILSLIMIIGIIYVVKHKDEIFNPRIKYQYPDGCVEVYLNTELITPECEYGKTINTSQMEGSNQLWIPDQIQIPKR